jgi:hypothetical protein
MSMIQFDGSSSEKATSQTLPVYTSGYGFVNAYTSLLWLVLTMIYIIGVGSHMTQAD